MLLAYKINMLIKRCKIDGITVDTSTDKVSYNGIEIKTEQLKELSKR